MVGSPRRRQSGTFLVDSGESSSDLRSRVLQVSATLKQEKADAVHRAEEAGRDRKFLDRLESIRTKLSDQHGPDEINSEYALAFRDFGIDPDRLDPEDAGRLLRMRSEPLEFAFSGRLDASSVARRGREGNDSRRRSSPPLVRPTRPSRDECDCSSMAKA